MVLAALLPVAALAQPITATPLAPPPGTAPQQAPPADTSPAPALTPLLPQGSPQPLMLIPPSVNTPLTPSAPGAPGSPPTPPNAPVAGAPLPNPPGSVPPAQAPSEQTPGQTAQPSPDATSQPAPDQGSAGQQAAPDATNPAAPEFPASPSWPNAWQPRPVAKLQLLDKVNAEARVVSVKVGQSVALGSLAIAVGACAIRPPDQPADATAFLTITDGHEQGPPVFRGWMLKSDPSLSMLEHPVYDVRVVGCGG
jgi:hypothetical protein